MARLLVRELVTTLENGLMRPLPNTEVTVNTVGTGNPTNVDIYEAASGGADVGPVLETDEFGQLEFYIEAADRRRFDLQANPIGLPTPDPLLNVSPLIDPKYLVLFDDPDATPGVISNLVLASPVLQNPTLEGGTFTAINLSAPVITDGGSWAGGPSIIGPTILTKLLLGANAPLKGLQGATEIEWARIENDHGTVRLLNDPFFLEYDTGLTDEQRNQRWQFERMLEIRHPSSSYPDLRVAPTRYASGASGAHRDADAKLWVRSLTIVEPDDPSEINRYRTGDQASNENAASLAGPTGGVISAIDRWFIRALDSSTPDFWNGMTKGVELFARHYGTANVANDVFATLCLNIFDYRYPGTGTPSNPLEPKGVLSIAKFGMLLSHFNESPQAEFATGMFEVGAIDSRPNVFRRLNGSLNDTMGLAFMIGANGQSYAANANTLGIGLVEPRVTQAAGALKSELVFRVNVGNNLAPVLKLRDDGKVEALYGFVTSGTKSQIIDPGRFHAEQGAPTQNDGTNLGGWAMADGDIVAAATEVPTDWTGGTINLKVRFAKIAAGSGNTRFTIHTALAGDGETPSLANTTSADIAVPGNQEQLDVTATIRSVTPAAAGQLLVIVVARAAGTVSNYAGTIRFWGIKMEYS